MFFAKMLARKIAPKFFSLIQTFFFFFKQINKKWGGGGRFLTPIFFICLYFIGVGGDEILKNYLAWPNPNTLLFPIKLKSNI